MPEINPLADMATDQSDPHLRVGSTSSRDADPENPALDGKRENALVRNDHRVDRVFFARLGKGASGTVSAIGVAPPG